MGMADPGADQREARVERVLHAQKMEAVGRLAGGVAHDFNNLLAAITTYADLALMELEDGHPVREEVAEIRAVADRAASLTRQLLAFSRKQVLASVPLDLNEVVAGIKKILNTLLGDDVLVCFSPGRELGCIHADPGQLEQVLVNLAVNARDAMPQGGRLTLETRNTLLDADYASRRPGVVPGPYVQLTVSDTGTGMDPTTASQIFEPFFTTKEPGKGTGLGLSTVYGIVKQSGGDIWVYSEPGRGTSFKLFFPRIEGVERDADVPTDEAESRGGGETILLVEDEDALRRPARKILEHKGYRVLEAGNPEEALAVAGRYRDAVDLVLTDVVMPGGSGPELARRLRASRPTLPVLYMSGYADEAIVHHGLLDGDAPLIQKPFTLEGLASRVREILDGAGAATTTWKGRWTP